jgi:hypothetical protein
VQACDGEFLGVLGGVIAAWERARASGESATSAKPSTIKTAGSPRASPAESPAGPAREPAAVEASAGSAPSIRKLLEVDKVQQNEANLLVFLGFGHQGELFWREIRLDRCKQFGVVFQHQRINSCDRIVRVVTAVVSTVVSAIGKLCFHEASQRLAFRLEQFLQRLFLGLVERDLFVAQRLLDLNQRGLWVCDEVLKAVTAAAASPAAAEESIEIGSSQGGAGVKIILTEGRCHRNRERNRAQKDFHGFSVRPDRDTGIGMGTQLLMCREV